MRIEVEESVKEELQSEDEDRDPVKAAEDGCVSLKEEEIKSEDGESVKAEIQDEEIKEEELVKEELKSEDEAGHPVKAEAFTEVKVEYDPEKDYVPAIEPDTDELTVTHVAIKRKRLRVKTHGGSGAAAPFAECGAVAKCDAALVEEGEMVEGHLKSEDEVSQLVKAKVSAGKGGSAGEENEQS